MNGTVLGAVARQNREVLGETLLTQLPVSHNNKIA